MSENQQGNNTFNFNQNPNNYNPLDSMQGDSAYIAKAFYAFADSINKHPDMFKGLGGQASTESQSNFAESKWKVSRENPKKTEADSKKYHSKGDILEDFEQGIKDGLLESLGMSNFKDGIKGALDTFQKEFGFDLRNIGHEAGKQLTKMGVDAFKNSKTGQELIGKAKGFAKEKFESIVKNPETREKLMNVGSDFLKYAKGGSGGPGGMMGELLKIGGQGGANGTVMADGAGTAFGTAAGGAGGAGGAAGGAVGAGTAGGAAGGIAGGAAGAGTAAGGAAGAGAAGGAASGIAALGPYAIVAVAIIAIAAILTKILAPAFQGLAEMAKQLGKSFNREEEMRKKMLENAKTRLEDDVKELAKKPFEILQEAAEAWASTWDSNLRQIGQTQGYDKETTYKLYESYAKRLRSEGLGSAINATDVVDKLSSVLDSGLSGRAAEEFAYIATKLGAAIPTQDFFSFADTYASVAANAIAQGQTQEQALATANTQLEEFASNLLYSSRELAGGFSTGLKNSESLFKDAVQIAQSAKTNNASAISGTLTSVSAIIGAVAPDLADSLVSNVVDAAIGGNSDTLVALRSLAGINASNTEFLKAMAENPQSIFADLFTNLANMQNMSPDNYMEVAEGLAEVFGIDKGAFARVDFNYLASAINAMNTNNQSLEENMALLQSGQTTTSAEQLKAQEINRVILEEGLAYVIDSEAGRMIQEHMWQEQIANEIENATYSVDLQGAALQFLEGIRKTVTNLLNFLNPIGALMKGISNMVKTTAEAMDNDQDIKEILQLGAVGSNSTALANLTTRGKDLHLTTSLVEMMGGQKGTALGNFLTGTANLAQLSTGGSGLFNALNDAGVATPGGAISKLVTSFTDTTKQLVRNATPISSRYDWGMVGKSVAKAIQDTPMNSKTLSSVVRASTESATKFAQEQSNKKFQEFIDTAEEASKNMNYDQWVATAKNYGISNFSDALDTYGRSEEELKAFFEANETRQGAIIEEDRKKDEELFRKQTREFWDFTSGTSGLFQTAVWFPFFGEGMKYDTRMDAVDDALFLIQERIGLEEKHTVIGGIEEVSRKLGDDTKFTVIGILETIESDISKTFMDGSVFQNCLADYVRYMANRDNVYYGKERGGLLHSSAWADLKAAQGEQQNKTLLALANAMNVFSADQLKNLDPQLQANALLGEIVIILQAIMQQNNTQAGGLSLLDTISALGLGVTKK
jgi:hypothetical protein